MTLYVVIQRVPFAELDVVVAADVRNVQEMLGVPPTSEVDGRAVLLKVLHLSELGVLRCHPLF